MGARFTQDRGGVLRDRLKAYWKLNERGGRRTDLVGTNHLTDFTGGNYARGRKTASQVGQFTSANSEYLSIPDNAALSIADIDFTVCAWVYLDTTASGQRILMKARSDANREYWLDYDAGGNRFEFGIGDDAGGTQNVGAGAPLSTATWYFVVGWLDATANTINISVNNGATSSAAQTITPVDSTGALNIGRHTAGGEHLNGRLAKVGFWKKVLTAAERTALYNNAQGVYYDGTRWYPSATPTSLSTSLQAWWELDETGTTRFDKVSPGTGPAAQFTAANTEYLSRVSNTSLETGDIDFTICGWIYLDDKVTTRTIAAKWDRPSPNLGGYQLEYEVGQDRFVFLVSSNGTTEISVKADALGSPSIATWYFVVGWHDSVNDTINIQVNGGTVDSAAHSGGVFNNTTVPFQIGARLSSGSPGDLQNGRLALVGFWKKVLTSTERTRLYNAGVGLHSTQLDTTLFTSLISYWNLNEGSGTRFDGLGSGVNDLTDNNTVTQATGVNGGNSLGDNNTVTNNQSFVTLDTAGLAGQFIAANSEYISIPLNSSVQPGDTDFTVAAWIYGDSFPSFATPIGTETSGTKRDWNVQINTDDKLFFEVFGTTGVQIGVRKAHTIGLLSTGRWYFVVAWHDSVNNTVSIQVNNGPVDSASTTGAAGTTATTLTIGAIPQPAGFWDGRIAGVGFWKRTLSTQERSDLYNGGRGSTIKSSSFSPDAEGNLDTALVSYWRLDEVSGTRFDRAAANDLTDNNTVGQAEGRRRIGYAGQFIRANSEYLDIPSNSELSTGDIDYTITGWFYLDSNTADGTVFSKDNGTATGREYRMKYDAGARRLEFTVKDEAEATVGPSIINFETSTWYFFVAWHDAVANTVNLQVNNGVVVSVAEPVGGPVITNVGFRIGANNNPTPGQFWDGRICQVGFWKRVLTPQERKDLYNGGRFSANDPDNTLPNKLAAYWSMDEATASTGRRIDLLSDNLLTNNNAVTGIAGKVGKASHFTAASSQYLSKADNDSLSTGDIDFTVAAWVYLDSKGANRTIVAKAQGGGVNEYALRYDSSTDRFQFQIFSGVNVDNVEANNLGSPSTATWYFVLGWHDASANTLNIQVNNGTADSAAETVVMADTASIFTIGAHGSAADFMDGRIDEVGFWKRTLTAAERTALYNSGTGITFIEPQGTTLGTRFAFDRGGTLGYRLVDYWRLDESSGTRRDSISAEDLTDNNTVTQAAGKIDKAAEFVKANVEYLSHADSTDLSTEGKNNFTFAFWFYADAFVTNTNLGIIAKDVGASRGWYIDAAHQGNNNKYRFEFGVASTPTGGATVVTANSVGNLEEKTWYFVVCWYDSTTDTVNIQVNNGTVDSVAIASLAPDNSPAFVIGADQSDASGGNTMNGRIDEVGLWSRVLTTREKTDLYNANRGKFDNDTNNTLLTDLKAYWPMDEVRRTRFDLISPGTGPAAQFTAANSEFLSIADNASLSTGDIDFTVSAWVYLDSKLAEMTFASKEDENTIREYRLSYDVSGDRFRLVCFNAAGVNIGNAVANTLGSPSVGTWYFIVGWHDATANTMNISVNNGATDSVSETGAIGDTTASFRIGADHSTPNALMNGRISLVGFWKKVLTAGERTALYNSGAGLHSTQLYPTLTSLRTSLISYWDLNEGSGTRSDDPGLSGNDLTDNNTVTQATGVSGGNTLGDNATVTRADGKVENAGQFTAANSEYLSIPDNADFSTGDIDFTIACWFYLDSASYPNILVAKRDLTDPTNEYLLYISSGDKAYFGIYDGAGTNNQVDSGTDTVSTGTWYFIVAWHDSVANTVNVQINNGTVHSLATTIVPSNTTATFKIGAQGASPTNFWNGRIDEVGFWKKVLTTQEKADLYTGGSGQTIGRRRGTTVHTSQKRKVHDESFSFIGV